MARDITMEMEIKPVVDTKGFDAGIRKLKSIAQKATSGRHDEAQLLTARLVSGMVLGGRATSATQARMQLASMIGVSNPATRTFLRGGQNIAQAAITAGRIQQYTSFSQGQIARMRPDLANLTASYNTALQNYAAFKAAPSEEGRAALLKELMRIGSSVDAIKQTRKKIPDSVKKIEKDAKAIGKDLSGWKDTIKPSNTANALGAAAFLQRAWGSLAKIFGVGSLVGAAKKWIDFGISGTKQGSADLAEQAMYGASRNIAVGRTRATMYGLDESITAAPERYALDFRQRMMWGEVSDKEWIALSKMGSLGRKIISGEAARNPAAFQRDIEKYITANRGNEAEVRQMLSWLGWSPQLMKYGAIQYSEEDKARLENAYAVYIKEQKDAAAMVWKTADEFDKFIKSLQAASASMLGVLVDSPESRKRLATAWGLAGYSDAERNAVVEEAKRAPKNSLPTPARALLDIGVFSGMFPRAIKEVANSFLATPTAPQYYIQNQTINVSSPDAETAGQSIIDVMGVKAGTWVNSNTTGGR